MRYWEGRVHEERALTSNIIPRHLTGVRASEAAKNEAIAGLVLELTLTENELTSLNQLSFDSRKSNRCNSFFTLFLKKFPFRCTLNHFSRTRINQSNKHVKKAI